MQSQLLIRSYGHGLMSVERVPRTDPEDGPPDPVMPAVAGLGIGYLAAVEDPGDVERVFLVCEDDGPPHPLQSGQLAEVAEALRSALARGGGLALARVAALLGLT